jgi:hypothetical protein
MKRALLVLALTAVLVMAAHSMALGANHHATGDLPSLGETFNTVWTDTWFYIDAESPKVLFAGAYSSNSSSVNAMYFKNDQTFAEASFDNSNVGDYTVIFGSYLFSNNIFAGMDYMEYFGDYVLLTLGYRFDIGDNDYVALSFDYQAAASGLGSTGTRGYDLDFKFFGDKYYLFGQLYFYDSGTDRHYVALSYQFSETFTGGISVQLLGSSSNEVLVGFTWAPENWIVDFWASQYDGSSNSSSSKISAMYQASEKLWIGLEAENRSSTNYPDSIIIAKAKYDFAGGQLRGFYKFANDNISPFNVSYFALAYEMKLK